MKIIFVLLILPNFLFSQIDSLKGNVKYVKEKIVFLVEKKLDKNTISLSPNEYGHYGFMDPATAIMRFDQLWFHTPWSDYINYERNYNLNKKITSETWYYKNDTVVANYTYRYDDRLNLVQESEFSSYSLYNSIKNRTYGDNNKIISSIKYHPNIADYYDYSFWLYDENNNVIEIKKFGSHRAFDGNKFEYNNKGKITKRIHFTPFEYSEQYKNNDYGYYHIYQEIFYDKIGNIIKTIEYDKPDYKGKKSIYDVMKYNYDKQNKKISEYRFYQNKKPSSYNEFEYYDNKLLKKEIRKDLKYPGENDVKEYFYDKNGNVTKLIYLENKITKVIDFEYKFDEKQNWIEQLKIIDSKPLVLRTRKIEYY